MNPNRMGYKNKKMKKKIAVVFGGYSSEYKISEKSARVIFEHIDRELFDPYMVEITRKSWHVNLKGGFDDDKISRKRTRMMEKLYPYIEVV